MKLQEIRGLNVNGNIPTVEVPDDITDLKGGSSISTTLQDLQENKLNKVLYGSRWVEGSVEDPVDYLITDDPTHKGIAIVGIDENEGLQTGLVVGDGATAIVTSSNDGFSQIFLSDGETLIDANNIQLNSQQHNVSLTAEGFKHNNHQLIDEENASDYLTLSQYETEDTINDILYTTYSISVSISNGSYVGNTVITDDGTAEVVLTADNHYTLPSTITVVNASYIYNNTTGIVELSNATGNISITCVCEQSVVSTSPTLSNIAMTFQQIPNTPGQYYYLQVFDSPLEYSDGTVINFGVDDNLPFTFEQNGTIYNVTTSTSTTLPLAQTPMSGLPESGYTGAYMGAIGGNGNGLSLVLAKDCNGFDFADTGDAIYEQGKYTLAAMSDYQLTNLNLVAVTNPNQV